MYFKFLLLLKIYQLETRKSSHLVYGDYSSFWN